MKTTLAYVLRAALAAKLLAGLFNVPVYASDITLTVVGTVGTGDVYDGIGLFGPAGTTYNSGTFVQTVTYDPSLFTTHTVGAYSNEATGTGPIVTNSVTFNGKTVSYTYAVSARQNFVSALQISDGLSQGVSGAYDSLSSQTSGVAAGTTEVESGIQDLNFSSGLGLSLGFDQNLTYLPNGSDYTASSFLVAQGPADTYLDAGTELTNSPSSVSLVCLNAGCPPAATTVPECETLPLLVLGIASVVLFRHRNAIRSCTGVSRLRPITRRGPSGECVLGAGSTA